ncbi:MAG: glycosyltransferase family 4 protein, partial [Miltoncostaeaceae bacterium]
MSTRQPLAGRRVVFVLYYYLPYRSGLTVAVQRLAEALAARGARVSVLCARHDDSLPAREVIGGVAVRRHRALLRAGKGILAPGITVAAMAAGRSATIVPVLPLAEAGAIALAVPRRNLLPYYICDLRIGAGRAARVVEALVAASARLAVRRARRTAVLSLEYARASRVIGGGGATPIPVPPPVDIEGYHPRDPASLFARLGMEGRQVVGFVGRVVYEKGIPVLVEAMRSVRRTHPDATLVIVGEGRRVAGGGILDEVQRMVHDDPGVIFTGFLDHDDLLAFYSGCAVLALPSIDPLEAFGLVQVEAMLCGCPVVASDMPGVTIPIRTTGMGELARPGDPADLTRALTAVLDDPQRYRRPRAEVAAAFDPERSYDTLTRA